MVNKRVRGWISGRSLPVLSFVKYPLPPLGGRSCGFAPEKAGKDISFADLWPVSNLQFISFQSWLSVLFTSDKVWTISNCILLTVLVIAQKLLYFDLFYYFVIITVYLFAQDHLYNSITYYNAINTILNSKSQKFF